MATLAAAAFSGSVVALNLIRQFLSYPSLTYIPVDSNGIPGIPQTVLFQVTGFRERGSNQVSKMLLVDVSVGKSFVSDNVAPLPRVWELEGFLFPTIASFPLVDQISLEVLKQTLRSARTSRQLLQFKPVVTDITSQFSQAFQSLASQTVTGTIPVMIIDMEFHLDATIINKAPFTMTLQEINTLTAQFTVADASIAVPSQITNPASAVDSNILGNTAITPVPVGFG